VEKKGKGEESKREKEGRKGGRRKGKERGFCAVAIFLGKP